MEDDPVRMTDVLDNLFTESLMRHDERVHAIIRGRLLSRYDKRRYILTETTAGLNHRPSPNPGSLAHQYIASEDHIIFQDTISGNCILEDYVIFGGNVLMSQGSRVGAWAMIQTGCRFRKDIPPFIVAAQEPTTYYGVNSFIMSHEGFSEKVIKHISHAYRIIFQGNSSLTDALLMIKDQVPMSKEIQHIIDFVGESKLGIVK